MKPPSRDNKAPRAGVPVSGQLLEAPQISPVTYAYWIALGVITLAGLVLRAAWLDHLMRYDEAYQFIQFANIKDGNLFFYQTPNNHVLHTMLVRLFVTFGGESPQVMRMPAFLAGVAIIPLAAVLARRISGRWEAGLIAAALAACSSILIEYSANARGYSMVCAATLAMAIFTTRVLADMRSKRAWAYWIAAGALGLFTIPVMAYPILLLSLLIVGQALWAHNDIAVRRWVVERVLASLVLLAAVTTVLYLPVAWVTSDELAKASGPGTSASLVHGYQMLWANRFVTPVSPGACVMQLGSAIVDTARHWTRDGGITWPLLLLAGVAGAVISAVRNRSAWGLAPIVGALLLLAAAVVQSVTIFPRVWLFLLPLVLAVAACGLVQFADLAGRRFKPAHALAAIGLLTAFTCGVSAWQTQHEGWLISEDPRTYTDIKAIARDISAAADGVTAVLVDEVGWPPLAYYCGRDGRTFPTPDSPLCQRLLTVTHTGEDPLPLRDRLAGMKDAFGPALPWRVYPSSTVYVSHRLAKGATDRQNLPVKMEPREQAQ